jgi:GNAT superfamily N-acetyltransferase
MCEVCEEVKTTAYCADSADTAVTRMSVADTSRVRAVDEINLPAVRAFLEQHADTSMFMLANLAINGPRAGAALNSANFKVIEENGDVRGVFYLSRRTTILAETGGRTELAPIIVEACRGESMPIGGVIGEWKLAEAIWSILRTLPGFAAVYESKEILQTLDLGRVSLSNRNPQVRLLRPADFGQWDQMSRAFAAEEGLPEHGTQSEREAMFTRNAEARVWWGYCENERLSSMACLNAVYKRVGQVGGVYTALDRRRHGLSRAVMNTLIADSVDMHELERLILFTGEHNTAARHLYETLGFTTIGDFALLMCAPIGHATAQ